MKKGNCQRTIRHAKPEDMEQIMDIMAAARETMRNNGNAHQWPEGYPPSTVIAEDIKLGCGYVITDDGATVAYFALRPSPEPTYKTLYDGKWIDDERDYHTLHRIASLPNTHGIFADVMRFCGKIDRNLRIDTHKDNAIMRHQISKHGFKYCGIIHVETGSERIAYQRTTAG